MSVFAEKLDLLRRGRERKARSRPLEAVRVTLEERYPGGAPAAGPDRQPRATPRQIAFDTGEPLLPAFAGDEVELVLHPMNDPLNTSARFG